MDRIVVALLPSAGQRSYCRKQIDTASDGSQRCRPSVFLPDKKGWGRILQRSSDYREENLTTWKKCPSSESDKKHFKSSGFRCSSSFVVRLTAGSRCGRHSSSKELLSSSTLILLKSGLSSGLALQHLSIISYRKLGQLGGAGIL